ncbi:MAG: hypothetical protein JWN44_2694 [Myxococcales bacterium]|nr:hypothetical protein [Myxococcales bacterium]
MLSGMVPITWQGMQHQRDRPSRTLATTCAGPEQAGQAMER